MVRTILLTINVYFFPFMLQQLHAQTVSNVYVEQDGNELLIHYSLSADSPCEVKLYVSQNGGRTWEGPLIQVTGDAGKNIANGEHMIRWNVLEEMEQLVGGNIKFKVAANSKKSFEPEMVFVKGGTFMMGSNNGDDDEKPVYQVTLSDFFIGKYEVTQAQWQAVMGNNPSNFKGCKNCPVEKVSWTDVQAYITKLNSQTGKNYRLPTEVEWEYAARGGNQSKGYIYSGSDNIGTVAWYYDNSSGKTHPVGQKQANELGINDMTGSVWEWCADWYGNYTTNAISNPQGSSIGQYRVFRGGSWGNGPQGCRTSNRNSDYPDFLFNDIGFRLVLVPAS